MTQDTIKITTSRRGANVFPCDYCHERFRVTLSFGSYYYAKENWEETGHLVVKSRISFTQLTAKEKFYKVNHGNPHKNQLYKCSKCAKIEL